jgi:hypothetical protein
MVDHMCEPICQSWFASCRSSRALQGGSGIALTLNWYHGGGPLDPGQEGWPEQADADHGGMSPAMIADIIKYKLDQKPYNRP